MALNAEHIRRLIDLQTHDQAIDAVDKSLLEIPVAIASLKEQIESARKRASQAKTQVQDFEKKKKERELELAQKEEAIRKHSGELNTVKTNEAFKALQTEIDRAKSEIGDIETAILELMDQIDAAQKELKKAAADFGAEEKVLLAQIAEKESGLAEIKAKKEALLGERQALAAPRPLDPCGIFEDVVS